ncbi:MAG: amidotransferase [Verrucomicrobia bacterium]|nr:amidotransferase [Verrucomicrobiota bacterium]
MTEVLVIQHQASEGAGTISEEIEASGRGIHLLRIDQGESVPSSPGAWKAVVVMGGTMGVYDQGKLRHLQEEISLLRLFLKEDRPVLGICLGAQLLAAALGAEVKPGVKEIGWVPVRKMPEAFKDPVLRRLPESFPALMWHGDHFALPKGAAHLLSTDQCACAGFRHGKKAYGLVPHLEMNAAMVDEMVATSRKELVAAEVEPARILEDTSEHAETVEELARGIWRAWLALVS